MGAAANSSFNIIPHSSFNIQHYSSFNIQHSTLFLIQKNFAMWKKVCIFAEYFISKKHVE